MNDKPQGELSLGGQIDAICDRFESDWRAKRRPAIESCLEQVDPSHQSYVLGELLFLELEYRQRYNERPTLQEYRSRFSQYDEIVAKVFADFVGWSSARIRKLKTSSIRDGRVSSGVRGSRGTDSGAIDDDFGFPGGSIIPRVLGNYVLLDLIGKGAMGVVYRALQRNVGRIVAIKLIRPDILSGLTDEQKKELIERFRTETLAAARLEHEHIVTVYEVGEVDGYHYYSMQYVEGQSLAELCGDSPMDNRRAAELLEPVARGVHVAHSCNILHRDLKPKNILVDFNTGQTLIADFGLAKLQEGGRNMTTTGDMIGSPAYMAPEQAMDSASVTIAADVYGLGATLYHLLTAKPPFQTAAVVMTIGQVIFDDPVPPRRLNPAVDQDVETICLKCLEKDPQRRYKSAEELADDLSRYINGEPIHARPIGPVGRLHRWCRRKPGLAALTTVAAALFVAVVVVASIGYQRVLAQRTLADLERVKAVDAEASEKRQRLLAERSEQEAQTNLKMAFQLVDRNQGLSDDPRLKGHDLESLRRELCEWARDFYDDIDGVDVRNRRGRIYVALASLAAETGETDKAMGWYRAALDVFDELRQEYPDSPEYQNQYAQHLRGLGTVYCNIGRLADADRAYQEAYEVCEQLCRAHPRVAQYRANLANTHQRIGILRRKMGLVQAAESDWQTAIDIWLQVLIDDPANAEYQHGLAQCHNNLANLFRDSSRYAEAKTEYRDALAIWEQLARDNPLIPEYRYMRAKCRSDLATLHRRLDQLEDAETEQLAALKTRERLAENHPKVPLYRSELAASYISLGALHEDAKSLKEAETAYRNSGQICEELVKVYGDVTEYRANWATSLFKLGALLINDGRDEEAVESFKRAEAQLETLTSRNEAPNFQAQLVDVRKNLAALFRRQKRLDEAEAALKAALQVHEQLVNDVPSAADRADALDALRVSLGGVCVERAELAASNDKRDEALTRYTDAIAALAPLADSLDNSQDAKAVLKKAFEGRADACDRLGQYADAVASWNQAIELEADDSRELLRLRRAVSLARQGDHQEAVREIQTLAAAITGKPDRLYDAACAYAAASCAVAVDKSVDGRQRGPLAEQYGARAVELLEQARQAGYFRTAEDAQHLSKDKTFAAIRHRDDFQKLLRRFGARDAGNNNFNILRLPSPRPLPRGIEEDAEGVSAPIPTRSADDRAGSPAAHMSRIQWGLENRRSPFRRAAAHSFSSGDHLLRIRASLRSTVRTVQSSFSAISSLL